MPKESGLRRLIKTAKEQYPHLDQRGLGPHALPYCSKCHSLDTVTCRMHIGTVLYYLETRPWMRRMTEAGRLRQHIDDWASENGISPDVSTGAVVVGMVHFGINVR